MKRKMVIGTRGSMLARIQADTVKQELLSRIPDLSVEIRIYTTKGDRILDSPLSRIGDKGLFIRELEEALIAGDISIAVHSMKDLPTELPPGLHIGAVLKRGEVRDAFISRDGRRLNTFGESDTIATSSLRRKAQLLSRNQGVSVIDIRGNVDTRLTKLESGYCDAIILAGAGLVRCGFEERITELLDPKVFIPAACQGIIGIESRRDDRDTSSVLRIINHEPTMLQAEAERRFLHVLEGGCQIPIGCRTVLEKEYFKIEGLLSSLDGTIWVRKTLSGTIKQAVTTAEMLAKQILREGGREILHAIR